MQIELQFNSIVVDEQDIFQIIPVCYSLPIERRRKGKSRRKKVVTVSSIISEIKEQIK